VVDLQDPIVAENGAEGLLDIDLIEKLAEHYPDAEEEIDDKVPEPLLDELKITAYVDNDHAHDKASCGQGHQKVPSSYCMSGVG
jgi:hypothetical protein